VKCQDCPAEATVEVWNTGKPLDVDPPFGATIVDMETGVSIAVPPAFPIRVVCSDCSHRYTWRPHLDSRPIRPKADRLAAAQAKVATLKERFFSKASPGYGKEYAYQEFTRARHELRAIEVEP
jgi:hypothetical protein